MATVSGSLKFDSARTAAFSDSLQGIANVPIVLQNTTTNTMLVVNTDSSGNYTFNNVPAGSYRLVEAYGMSAVVSPGDFNQATVGSVAVSNFPPISAVTNPPAGSTNLDALIPTTILLTVADADVSGQNFLNGPVKYTPITEKMDKNVTIFPTNLIVNGERGSFGTFPAGTPANTGAGDYPGNLGPYPDIKTNFWYVQPNPQNVTPIDGQYTVQNTMTNAQAQVFQNTWWRISDHTTGNETGRMLVVNGDTPGAVIFQETVAVKPSTYYLFSTWILNLSKSASIVDPSLGVEVLAADGTTLYKATLGELIQRNENSPEWKQIGTLIDTKNNSSITVKFTSEGPAALGNDYAIDDIGLQEIRIADYNPQKSVSPSAVVVGENVTYTVTLPNTGTQPLTDVTLKDLVPDGFTFVTGSTIINGVANTSADPNSGFSVPNINGGTSLTVTFRATANKIPTVNPAVNTANIDYAYSPIQGGLQNRFSIVTNPARATVNAPESADLQIVKTASSNTVQAGGVLTYTLTVTNNGPSSAQNVTIGDAPPSKLGGVEYSTDNGTTWASWSGSYNAGTLANGATVAILIRGTVNPGATGTIMNTAIVESVTPDPNSNNNSSNVNTNITNAADMSITKSGDHSPAKTGELLTYRLTAKNNGPNDAQAVSISDSVPTSLTNPEYSLDGGTSWASWSGTYSAGVVTNGTTINVLVRGTVSSSAPDSISNTAVISSTTLDPNTANNSSTEITPITKSADLSVSKRSDATSILAGNRLTYTIDIENHGPDAAQDVNLQDSTPTGLLSPEFSTDGGVTWTAWSGTLAIGNLPLSAKRTVLIRGTVSATSSGTLMNSAAVSSKTPDPNPSNNSSVSVTTVTFAADLSITKTATSVSVQPGDILTYTITATNNGPHEARAVVINDTPPLSLSTSEYSIDNGVTWTAWSGSYSAGNLANGSTVSLLMRGMVASGATGNITNTASVGSTTPDPNTANNSSTEITPIRDSANLNVVKSADRNPVPAGGILTYNLSVTNNGPGNAKDVVLSDSFPPELSGVQYSTDNGTTWTTWSGSLALGTLNSGASVRTLIRGTVSASAVGVIENTATVRSSTPDPDPTDNTSKVNISINTSADLSISKKSDQNPVRTGNVLTYSIVATNNGPNDAQNTVINDNVPAALSNVEFSADNGGTWNVWNGAYNIGTFANGATVTLLMRGTVAAGASGTITNTAQISSSTPDPNQSNNSSTDITAINLAADLSIIKRGDKSSVQAGSVLTYTLAVSNAGPNDAQDVVITDTAPTSLTGVQFSNDGGITWQSWSGSFAIPTLANGASVFVLLRGTASESASAIANTASVTSSTTDPNTGNNTSTVNTPITTSADLEVQKTASATSVLPGDNLSYTITLSNKGPNTARDVLLSDTVPAELTNPQYSLDGGTTYLSWTGSYSVETMGSGASVVILIRGTVSQTANGNIANTATASSSTPDPNPKNNSSIVIVPALRLADLVITKSGDTSPVVVGDTLTYVLRIENKGPNDAQDVTLVDFPPDVLSNAQYSADRGTTWQPWSSFIDLGTIKSGDSMSVLLRTIVGASASGIIPNTAAVYSETPDPDITNNSGTEMTPVTNIADVEIIKTASPSQVTVGERITYTIKAVNHGPNNAADVVIEDTLPSSLSGAEYSIDGGATWQIWRGTYAIGTVNSGSTSTLLIRATLNAQGSGILTNTAIVSSSTPDPNPKNNSNTVTTQVSTSADLSITKVSDRNSVSGGDILAYTIKAVNNGPNEAKSAIITDPIPQALTAAEYSTDGGTTWSPWSGFYPLGNLASGAIVNLTVRGRVRRTASGVIANTVAIDSNPPDPNQKNNSSVVLTPINAVADLSIIKSANKNPVHPGDVLTYTLIVTNNGPNSAMDVTLSDTLPQGLSNPEFSIDNGTTWAAWSGSTTLGLLANNASRSVLVRGTVVSSTAGEITNTAEVRSATPDPNPSNNTTQARTTVEIPIIPTTPKADLSLTKIATTTCVQPGDQIIYSLDIVNSGPEEATNVVLRDILPTNIIDNYYSIDGGQSWSMWSGKLSLGNILAGTQITVLIKGILDCCSCGKVTNTAWVISDTKDDNLDNNHSQAEVIVRSRRIFRR